MEWELGFGAAVWHDVFRAQVFVQLSAELSLAMNCKRDSPDGAEGFDVPLKLGGKGVVGFRFEAGNLISLIGQGEAGIEFTGKLGVNLKADRMFRLDMDGKFTGIKVSFLMKKGLKGSRTEKVLYEKVLMEQAPLFEGFHWPDKEEPFNPPYVSRERIHQLLVEEFEQQPSLAIRDAKGDRDATAESLSKLADIIDQYPNIDRSEKMIKGLVKGIKEDLQGFCVKPWIASNWVSGTVLESGGWAETKLKRQRLQGLVSPAQQLASSSGFEKRPHQE